MRRRYQAIICVLFALTMFKINIAAAQVFDSRYAESEVVDLSLGTALFSSRMFRGQNLYNDTSIQPHAKAEVDSALGIFFVDIFTHFSGGQGDARASHGGSFEVSNPDSEEGDDNNTLKVAAVTPSFTEINYALGVKFNLNLFSLEVGHRWYNYSKSTVRLKDSAEFFTIIDFNLIANPYFTLAYDWDRRSGMYFEVGARQEIPLQHLHNSLTGSLIPFIRIGGSNDLNDKDAPIYKDSGLAMIELGLGSSFPISQQIALEPKVSYSEGIDDYADSEFVFGINLVGTLGL